MVVIANPFASIETRWFLDGDPHQHEAVSDWFENYRPFDSEGNVGPPNWLSRIGGEPDSYLLLPGYSSMGIKWREGTLQVKGLVADLGERTFGDHHEGRVQRWIKWTLDSLPPTYRDLFHGETGLRVEKARVQKVRALRLFRLDKANDPTEVEPGLCLERGLAFELTDLERAGRRYCSLAFEAFPGDEVMAREFCAVVECLLGGLSLVALDAGQSLSYPAWLPLRQRLSATRPEFV
jgi:hypothetical protein